MYKDLINKKCNIASIHVKARWFMNSSLRKDAMKTMPLLDIWQSHDISTLMSSSTNTNSHINPCKSASIISITQSKQVNKKKIKLPPTRKLSAKIFKNPNPSFTQPKIKFYGLKEPHGEG